MTDSTTSKMSTADHPSDETFERLAFHELDAVRTAEVMAHLEDCDECAVVWRAVESMRDAAVEFDRGAVPASRFNAPRRSPSRRIMLPLAAAAAVLAVTVLTWPFWWTPPTTPDDGGTVVRAGEQVCPVPVFPEEGGRVAEPSFRWNPADESAGDTAGYILELLDENGEVLWVSERLARTEAPWPESVQVGPGVYFWRVSAHFEDGEETLSSPLVSFEVSDQ